MPGYSLLVNLTLLAPSIFMLQVFDHVLSTRSVETLVVMGVMAVMAGLRRGGARQGTSTDRADNVGLTAVKDNSRLGILQPRL